MCLYMLNRPLEQARKADPVPHLERETKDLDMRLNIGSSMVNFDIAYHLRR